MTVLYLNSPLNLAIDGDDLPKTLNGKAYAGGRVSTRELDNFVIDISTAQLDSGSHLFKDHDPRLIVGNIKDVTLSDEINIHSDFFSDIDDDAKQIALKAKRGTKYELSLGVRTGIVNLIKTGIVMVNGREFDAPISVVKNAVIPEVSIVTFGADSETSATFMSKHHEDESMAQPKPDNTVSVDAELTAENSALKTQVIELTAQLDLQKAAAATAVTEKDAIALQLSQIVESQRVDDVKGLFASVGKDYTEGNAKPYLQMSKESFDAVAGDFKAKKPTVESLQLGAYDFGADEDDKGKETFSLTQCAADQEAFAAKMEGRAN
jgi:hypothetical protein